MSSDEQAGVKGRSPFYDLPYFRMDMVQYDLMHTATGVLATYFKAYSTPSHPWHLSKGRREDVTQHAAYMHTARRPRGELLSLVCLLCWL
jgi:hypothetical protein